MKRNRLLCLLLACLLAMLWGCGNRDMELQPETAEESIAEPTVPATVPPDGDPADVTCKGSYTSSEGGDTQVATAGTAQLTNRELWVWYWAAVAQYRQDHPGEGPDYTRPLDTQACGIDSSVNTWQQYFLRQALDNWHAAQALAQQAVQLPLETEEAYKPNMTTHANCMTGMPATKFLYGYDKVYETNTMHQAYLDNIPQQLLVLAGERGYSTVDEMAREVFGCSGETLAEAVRQYNYAYMYLTFLTYDLEFSQERVDLAYRSNPGKYAGEEGARAVSIRHILLIPQDGSAESLQLCQEEADDLLRQWQTKSKAEEHAFAELAYRYSQDTGTAANGGGYFGLTRGQLPGELESWCFDEARKTGDTTVLTTEQGVHILYFIESQAAWQQAVWEDLTRQHLLDQTQAAEIRCPLEVTYSAITLAPAQGGLSYGDLLYPDIAHERYPEVPLYLQQDYPNTYYGSYLIRSHGCGITTFSMLTTYMSDEEWTPPEMCDRYGHYSFHNGTDGMLFIKEPAKYGYFFRERTFEQAAVKQALEEGCLVVSIQHKGYWTSGGHYLLFEKLTEDGMVQVRDSNIANYKKLPAHAEDKHTWGNCVSASDGYWIFEAKVTRCNACSRCGTPEEARLLQTDYLCPKCVDAVSRRSGYLHLN